MNLQKIKRVNRIGVQKTLDFEVSHKDHNFYAEGIVVSNSHSVSTSLLTALTVWCKYTHPLEFYLCCLNASRNLPDTLGEIQSINAELHNFGIKLLPPHILKSSLDFTIEGGNIRYGLSAIKGISEQTIEKLNSFRHPKSTKFELFQSADESKISIGVLSTLLQAGALDDYYKQSRSRMVYECQVWNELTDREKILVMPLGEQFDYDLIDIIIYLNTVAKTETGKPMIKDSRYATIKKDTEKFKQIYAINSNSEKIASYEYEYRLLGFSYSATLREIYGTARLLSISQVNECDENQNVKFVGRIMEVNEALAKNKKTRFLKFLLKDERATCTVLVFNDEIENVKNANGGEFEEGDVISVVGNKKKDCVFSSFIEKRTSQVYLKLGELRKYEKAQKKVDKNKEHA